MRLVFCGIDNTTGKGENAATVFLLINTSGAVQNIDREPLFCAQFAKQKVCPILHFFVLRGNIYQIKGNLIKFLKYCFNQLMSTSLSRFKGKLLWGGGGGGGGALLLGEVRYLTSPLYQNVFYSSQNKP